MSKLVAAADASSSAALSRIGFATEGGGSWKEWDRFITIDGKNAYHIGNICGTCAFVFERLSGANDKVSPAELSAQLRQGLTRLDDNVVRSVTATLPAGSYKVLLLNCVPRLVLPSKAGDYFAEEQVRLWGIDTFWGLPHYTKTEYYRGDSLNLGNGRGLFEFVIPMFPQTFLHADALNSYKAALSQGSIPTALALSILDVKQPADWDGNPQTNEHWCLAHYLLDGHHKVYAAGELAKPVSILSFLAIDKGISSRGQVAEVVQTFKNR